MLPFSTEFPVRSTVKREQFLDLVIRWLHGAESSNVLSQVSGVQDLTGDDELKSPSGERLTIRECPLDDGHVIGLRHQIPDNGRIWLTDCVLTQRGARASIRVRGQCQLSDPTARAEQPKKPFLIKMMMKEEWGGNDCGFAVSDIPKHLVHAEVSEIADVINRPGKATGMPVVFVSRNQTGETLLDCPKLAYDLGGMAHIVVEPDRFFSSALMQATFGRNPYLGSIGVCAPNRGIVKRFFIGELFPDSRALEIAIRQYVASLTAMWSAASGWEWRDLSESYAKRSTLLEREQGNKKIEEYITLFDAEIREKDLLIDQLRTSLDEREKELERFSENSSGILRDGLLEDDQRQIYDGEISDRVVVAVRKAVEGQSTVVEGREREALAAFLKRAKLTGRAHQLQDALRRGARSSDGDFSELQSILMSLGFERTEEGPHIKLTPPEGLKSVGTQSFPRTTSDFRAVRNQASQLTNAVDLRHLLE